MSLRARHESGNPQLANMDCHVATQASLLAMTAVASFGVIRFLRERLFSPREEAWDTLAVLFVFGIFPGADFFG